MTKTKYTDRLFELISKMPADEQKKLLDRLETAERNRARKHPRKDYLISVHYVVRGRAYQNFIEDISIGGIFIETRERLSVGDDLLLTISYSDQVKPFKITGEVARIEINGVGVKFKKLTRVQAEMLKAIISKASASKKIVIDGVRAG